MSQENGASKEALVDILLVDDREDGLLSLEAVLGEEEGYRLTRASSGMEAIARLYEKDFALILLDVQMPELNGFETAKIIRSHEASREVPIIFITAISRDSVHIYEGYESGAVDYLLKPFDPYILRSKTKIFAELYRKNLKIREQARLLVQAEQRRSLDLSLLNRQLEIEMEERSKAQKEILQISEREQKRIGQDLHDGLAQELSAMSFMCRSLQQRLEKKQETELAATALQILELSKKAIQETKSMGRVFYPIELEKLGLLGALQEMACATTRVFEVDCSFRSDQAFTLSEEAATHVYRIAQESVHNAIRHGGAKKISIEIEVMHEDAMLTIADDGAGFSQDSQAAAGMGLRIMDYRAKMIGGRLNVTEGTAQGSQRGTTIECRFPLASNGYVAHGTLSSMITTAR